jgi:hypothetical protein
MNFKISICALALLCSIPVSPMGAAANPASSFVDKKMIFSVAGGALFALLVVTYMKIRSMISYAGNTPIGVVSIQDLSDASVYLKQLQKYAHDPMIKGILIQVNSSGGVLQGQPMCYTRNCYGLEEESLLSP